MRKIGTAVATTLFAGVMLAGPTIASAAPQQPTQPAEATSASACLKGYSGPYDEVNTYQGITLRCGAGVTGVLKIDRKHPIAEDGSDDVDVERCMNNILAYGAPYPADKGHLARQITKAVGGGYAVIVWDKSSNDVVTMYTSDSNNWAACAAYR